MSRRDEILSEMGTLNGYISGYNDDISELEAAATYIQERDGNIVEISDYLTEYDVSKDQQWRGFLNDKMSDERDGIVGAIRGYRGQVGNFLQAIDEAIGKLKEKIKSCLSRLSELQSELDSLPSDEEATA